MSSEARYRILYDGDEASYNLKISLAKCSWGTVFLPFSAFVFCVVYSVLFNFDRTTFTHCNVYNFLPSISAAIGSYSPQKEVWQIAIYLHCIPRLCIAYVYYQHNKDVLKSETKILRIVAFITSVIENLALVTLSYWTSSDNYAVHKISFMTFILVSIFYMSLTLYLYNNCRKPQKNSYTIRKSIKWKKRLVFTNIMSTSAALYFFIRHNTHCEPYVYTAFAICEYITVLTNMGFHSTAYFDLWQKDFVLHSRGITFMSR